MILVCGKLFRSEDNSGGSRGKLVNIVVGFKTGEIAPLSGDYEFLAHIEPTNCVPTPDERQISLSMDDPFPMHRPCGQAVIWKFVPHFR